MDKAAKTPGTFASLLGSGSALGPAAFGGHKGRYNEPAEGLVDRESALVFSKQRKQQANQTSSREGMPSLGLLLSHKRWEIYLRGQEQADPWFDYLKSC